MTRAERFWTHVNKAGPEVRAGLGSCWTWTGSINQRRGGYGLTHDERRRTRYAHRVAFELATGLSPGGLFVCHRCDNPPCCNPAHLFLGTQAENSQDMVAKGRASRVGFPGSRNGRARMTESDAKAAIAARAAGESVRDIAARHGVCASAIYHLTNGRNWKCLRGDAAVVKS